MAADEKSFRKRLSATVLCGTAGFVVMMLVLCAFAALLGNTAEPESFYYAAAVACSVAGGLTCGIAGAHSGGLIRAIASGVFMTLILVVGSIAMPDGSGASSLGLILTRAAMIFGSSVIGGLLPAIFGKRKWHAGRKKKARRR